MEHAILAQNTSILLGPLEVHYYGLIIGVAVVCAIGVFIKITNPKYTDVKSLLLLILSTFVSAVFAGRLLYVFINLDMYTYDWLSALSLWEGGITIAGVLLGGIIGYSVYWKFYLKQKFPDLNYFYILDRGLIVTALAQAIGRWGNFVNQELYGPPTKRPWGIYISPENRLARYDDYDYFHPAFLYESILNFINFLILLIFIKCENATTLAKTTRRGTATGLYLMNYGIIRLVVERFRIDSEPVWLGLKLADYMAIILILAGISVIAFTSLKCRAKTVEE